MASRSSKARCHPEPARRASANLPTETLIVWTEPSNGVDMALSFQEAEGCSMIWYVASPSPLPVVAFDKDADFSSLTRILGSSSAPSNSRSQVI